ncbi:uncharacterized protein UTRI_01679_B [Ustilago trichophora]|uniref:Bromo domain-containing protein n=1 Tax=Ustilago trichophora TaxID=86804 RepID=A0A5C3E5M3_9BASI|nr:uncharacterized protein UTRI_01679_B [Ustilago trichophora]
MSTSAMTADATAVNNVAASYQVASSSAASLQPRKAVMLKGPSLTSKTYFVPLPDTLDGLVAKAVQLFPIPPGKVPHITLGTDERAIILEESYDFIRDRELLHFRWSAETPRRNLANRVRWDAPSGSGATSPFCLNPSASPQSISSEAQVASPVTPAAEVLKTQLQGSPTSTRNLASTTRANTIANRDPNTQFGEGVAARKAHVQRVLAEQQRKREEEHTADALGAAPVIADVEQETVADVDVDPEATAKAALELAATSVAMEAVQEAADSAEIGDIAPASSQDVDMSTIQDKRSHNAAESASPATDSVAEVEEQQVLLAPAAATINLESPPRKKPVDNGGLDTPPSSGSRSSSPFHSSDRALTNTRALEHRLRANADDEPSSSPISSPTRDVSSRYRNALSTVPMPELGKQQPVQEQSSNEVVAAELAASRIDAAIEQAEGNIAEQQEINANSEEPVSPSKTIATTLNAVTKPIVSQANDPELTRIYSFLSNLVSQLLSHKANWAFQRPMSVEFEQFSSRSSRPVDLFTIRDSLASRKYGSQHLEGRMAANAVVTDFEDDLTLLYTNARRFFGVRSTQAECVEHLEKFSKSFLNEWKRTQGSAAQRNVESQRNSASQLTADAAAARLSMYRSPGSRSEKRPALSSSPFAMLLTPGSSAVNANTAGSVGRKTVGLNGQLLPNAVGVMRRPDFGFKRNTSYEGNLSAAKRPAQPTRTTSEAFERALRAATATPQAERVKPRQEVVAPFATRSVIETDFMARPAAQQQQQQPQQAEVSPMPAAQTPTSSANKRKLGEAKLDNNSQDSMPRTPSVSPPPSPSPTKRNKPAVALKPSKSATRRINKKKAKQAAAAAAAAAAALELTEQKRGKKGSSGDSDEEQRVLDLLDPSPPAKRARTAKQANFNVDSEPTTPELKTVGKGKGKKSRSPPTQAESHLLDLPLTPSTPSGRMLRPRRGTAEPHDVLPPPRTPPRSAKKGNSTNMVVEGQIETANESMDVDGFEVTGSRRRSSRQRKPVNLD